jgi:hypothetical protein
MAEHKFEFVVAGIELSEQVRQRISADIALAVTHAIATLQPGQVHGPVWAGGVGPINGGRLLFGALADRAREAVQKVKAGR